MAKIRTSKKTYQKAMDRVVKSKFEHENKKIVPDGNRTTVVYLNSNPFRSLGVLAVYRTRVIPNFEFYNSGDEQTAFEEGHNKERIAMWNSRSQMMISAGVIPKNILGDLEAFTKYMDSQVYRIKKEDAEKQIKHARKRKENLETEIEKLKEIAW